MPKVKERGILFSAQMTRYRVLRLTGCDPLTAGTIALLNWMRGVPAGLIFFMTVVIEYDPQEQPE